MITRTLEKKLKELTTYYPVVLVTGPRQSGKTTLCRMAFPDKHYLSLESPDVREYARNDPREFLEKHREGAILDEIQYAPDLLSYLQTEVDLNPLPGRFILTGSQHFALSQSIAQSLAGRCGILTLLPPALPELRKFDSAPDDLFTLIWQGAYPRIYDRNIPPQQWLADYTDTYIQRDVRQVVNVGDLQTFTGFLKLCAGRTAQELNLSSLGGDAGISRNTVQSWLSVLETSYIIQRLPAWHRNIRKQVAKTPKLHFLDSGLACYLLGIREPGQLALHPLRGALFESWVVSEVTKSFMHQGRRPDLFHFRTPRGPEIDLIIDHGASLSAIEIKSGLTWHQEFFDNLIRFKERFIELKGGTDVRLNLVYGGEESFRRSGSRVVSWREVDNLSD